MLVYIDLNTETSSWYSSIRAAVVNLLIEWHKQGIEVWTAFCLLYSGYGPSDIPLLAVNFWPWIIII